MMADRVIVRCQNSQRMTGVTDGRLVDDSNKAGQRKCGASE